MGGNPGCKALYIPRGGSKVWGKNGDLTKAPLYKMLAGDWGSDTPKIGGSIVFECMRSFSSSASCNRFDFARRFWNHIFTCVSVKFKDAENSALSAMDRYCFSRNFFSNESSWEVVNGVRGFRLGLCLRRVPTAFGGILGALGTSENK